MPEDIYVLRQSGATIQQILDSLESQASDISGKADRTYVDSALANKVDKVSGKGLSTNDYTTADRQKLASIAANAQQNVPSDWNAEVGDARILNKPDLSQYATKTEVQQAIAGVTVDLSAYSTTQQMQMAIAAAGATKVDKVEGKGLSTNDFTDAEKTKLGNIQAGAQANVPSDWNATSGAERILNKPDLGIYATRTQVEEAIENIDMSDYPTREEVRDMVIDVEGMPFVSVESLPTASSATMGTVYVVASGSSTNSPMYMTELKNGAYSWKQIGSTEITLGDPLTSQEVSALLDL